MKDKKVFVFRYVKDGTPYGTWAAFAPSEEIARMELAVRYNLGDTPLELVESFADRRQNERDRRASF